MSSLPVFLGLLLLAYIGSFLVGERRIRGFGLPSGAEYLVLGFLLGPAVFGLLDHATLRTFDPIADVAVGWIALVIGLGFGVDRRRRTRPGHLALAAVVSLFTAVAVAVPLFFAVTYWTELRGQERLFVVTGGALVSAETTRESVRWVAERYGARGYLSSIVSDLARSDDVVPILAVAIVFALAAKAHLPWPMHPVSWTGLTLGIGVVFGGTAALIIGRDLHTDETWGTLLGISVLGVGITTRLGLSTVTAMFAMGLATALFSGHRQALLAMVEPTERTVLHPVLLLAGARIELATKALPLILIAALLARTSAKALVGGVWQAASQPARRAGPFLGLGLLSAGTLSMTLGLAFALRFPGAVGDYVLAIATAATIFGEFVGPFALRASLRRAGEIEETATLPAARPTPQDHRRRGRMSGHGGAKIAWGGRVIQAAALATISVFLYFATRAVPESAGSVGTIAAVGYLLLAGTLTSELVAIIKLPHLTGYLLAGIIAGPHVLALIDEGSVKDLTVSNELALALIALEGGAHLRLAALRRGARSLAWSTLLQTVLVLVCVTGVFMALRRYIPFAQSLSTPALIGTALLWGTMSVTRSPSATLGILAETRAVGPVMTGTLSFIMTSDVVVVVTLATVLVFARPMIDPSATFSLGDLSNLAHDLLGSVALGTTLGIILALYTRFIRAQLLLVFLALGFGLSELLAYLHFDSLLAFMVAGFVVQNLSEQGEAFIEGLEKTGSVVFVIFFATAGAHLDLPLLRQLWPIALALAASRAGITYVSGRLASHLANDPPSVKKWGWAGLVSQAGLALGVAAMIERTFPMLGSGFRALAIATVAFNEMVGPVLFKLALDRAGETSHVPRPTLTSLDGETPHLS